jgi:hypothetical protein
LEGRWFFSSLPLLLSLLFLLAVQSGKLSLNTTLVIEFKRSPTIIRQFLGSAIDTVTNYITYPKEVTGFLELDSGNNNGRLRSAQLLF